VADGTSSRIRITWPSTGISGQALSGRALCKPRSSVQRWRSPLPGRSTATVDLRSTFGRWRGRSDIISPPSSSTEAHLRLSTGSTRRLLCATYLERSSAGKEMPSWAAPIRLDRPPFLAAVAARVTYWWPDPASDSMSPIYSADREIRRTPAAHTHPGPSAGRRERLSGWLQHLIAVRGDARHSTLFTMNRQIPTPPGLQGFGARRQQVL